MQEADQEEALSSNLESGCDSEYLLNSDLIFTLTLWSAAWMACGLRTAAGLKEREMQFETHKVSHENEKNLSIYKRNS